MFTGIIETLGNIIAIEQDQSNINIEMACSILNELKIDQSIAHDGVCLTIVDIKENSYIVTAVEETLNKTTISNWKPNQSVNLERCLKADSRFDGHIVQGHVDTIAQCTQVNQNNGSWLYTFQFSSKFEDLIVEKGSITINGISLTIVNIEKNEFTVAIIPYTYNNTNIQFVKKASFVNLEFDIIGKYIKKALNKQL